MERSYERQLAEVVGRLPDEPAVVALIPTIPLDQAAALASDVAQTVGSGRRGHTILTSLEPAGARLDHEIGVEDCEGLTDVLTGRIPLARVAAHGRARRFIYVPAGERPAPGDRVLRSDAWRALAAGILDRGGTVLAFIPPDVFEAVNALPSEGAGRRFDALIWLGPARGPSAEIRAAAIASGALDAGGVDLPGPSISASARAASPGEADAANGSPPAGAPADAPPAGAGADTRAAARPGSGRGTGLVGVRRRRTRRRKRRRSWGTLAALIVVGGGLGLWAGFEVRARWFPASRTAAPDFARPDSAAAAGDSAAADSAEAARDSAESGGGDAPAGGGTDGETGPGL